MRVKKVSNLVAEIDGTEVTLIPVSIKTISVPVPNPSSTGSAQYAVAPNKYEVFGPAIGTEKVVGYLLVAPEVTE